MKTIPPPCPEPESGRRYWRSLDQWADNAEFRQYLEREFPANASEWTDPVSRRHFVKIMSASLLLGGVGLTGCRPPEEHILPFGKMPENYIHGVPKAFATAMPSRGTAIPLVVRSNDGRPTKIEGNPEYPGSNGSTDAFTQASILSLYDPDRADRFAHNGGSVTRAEALAFLGQLSARLAATSGQGLRFLMDRSASPSRIRMQRAISQRFQLARWHTYEAIDFDIASESGAGKSVVPYFRLEGAKVILSLDCDFMAEQDSARAIQGFAQGRKLQKANPKDELGMNRLYVVEGLLTLTGINADHRLRTPASTVIAITAAIAKRIVAGNASVAEFAERYPLPAGIDPAWISECVNDLLARRGESLVLAGHRQPTAVRVMADLMNASLGNIGKTAFFHETDAVRSEGIAELIQALNANQVDTLVIFGGNPGYDAPVDLEWSKAQARAKTVVRLSLYEDETSWHDELYPDAAQKPDHWDLPATHYLESWSDGRTEDGTLVPVQPLIAPLFDGVMELEVLARLAAQTVTNPYEIVRETFRGIGGADDNAWRRFLHDGFLPGSAAPIDSVIQFPLQNVDVLLKSAVVLPAPARDKLEVIFARSSGMDDGRHNNNGWLQEFPDPVTKLTWENVVMLSPKTANDLGVSKMEEKQGTLAVPVVKVDLGGGRSIEGPVWIQPGMADDTIGLQLGYGRRRTGRVGNGMGYNAYRMRTAAAPYVAAGATLTVVNKRTHVLASTQNHWSMEGRPIIREANLKFYQEHPEFVTKMDLEMPPVVAPLYPNPLDAAKPKELHQWGMAIDLTSCVGCSACVLACQSENNIPIVGKEQVAKSREMHWLRIDRYYTGPREDPETIFQPMLCQHCEAAPCESVCPVNATVHDTEGLNLMIYNRCVGTRYCSNNCPYKVRRFNYFDYNKRPLAHLYKSPFNSVTRGKWELLRWFGEPDKGSVEEDQWDLLKMVRNPDVTVRMRGVMEKCTFCVQRIEQAKIGQKVKARDSGAEIAVPDGTLKTACQQACPAEAIVFGNVADANSQVSKLKTQQRNYSVLDFLMTKPRLTYLARIRNPNPKMPEEVNSPMPRSWEEFEKKNGDPYKHHGAETPHEKGAV